jgi:hypothetical protein
VEDHHVDRPGVEALQGVELTGTNSSIGLIALIKQCSLGVCLRMLVGGEKSPRREIVEQKDQFSSPFC